MARCWTRRVQTGSPGEPGLLHRPGRRGGNEDHEQRTVPEARAVMTAVEDADPSVKVIDV